MARSKPLGRSVAAGQVISPDGFRVCKLGVRRGRGEPQLIRDGERPQELSTQWPGAFGSASRPYSVRLAALPGSRPLQAAETRGKGSRPGLTPPAPEVNSGG